MSSNNESVQFPEEVLKKAFSRANARCLFCKQVTSSNMIREFAKEGKIGQLMTIVILRHPTKTKKIYRPATSHDLEIYNLWAYCDNMKF